MQISIANNFWQELPFSKIIKIIYQILMTENQSQTFYVIGFLIPRLWYTLYNFVISEKCIKTISCLVFSH